MPDEAWTIGTVLSWTAERFEREGIESARLDAELLLAESLGVERLRLYLDYAKPLQAPELAGYRALIKRRLAREPVAYITGRREFWSLELGVTSDVLVPRPESELLVELTVEHARALPAREQGLRVLDVGTGSGAIAIAVAHELARRASSERHENADEPAVAPRVVAVDDQPGALDVARANAARHGVDVTFYGGDLLEALPAETAPFDVIVSNPPYIASGELDELMPEVSCHEPRHALDGGADGLDVIRRLATQAAAMLAPGGLLMIEIGWQQGPAVAALLEQQGLIADVRKDLAGLDRVVRGRR